MDFEALRDRLAFLSNGELCSRFQTLVGQETSDADAAELDAICQVLRERRLTQASAGATLDDAEVLASKLKAQKVLGDLNGAAQTARALQAILNGLFEPMDQYYRDINDSRGPTPF